MSFSPTAPPADGNLPAPAYQYPGQPPVAPQGYAQPNVPPQPYPGQPAMPFPGQMGGPSPIYPGQPAMPFPGQPGQPQPYPTVGQPYQNIYPNLPPPDYKDPGLSPYPNEPPPPYKQPILPNRPAPPTPQEPVMPNIYSYQETPIPSGLSLVWSGCEGVEVFFIQPDGQVVNPQGPPIKIDFYARGTGSMRQHDVVAVIDIPRVWRIKITNESCYVVKGKYEDLAFLDHSTQPSTDRVTVLRFPPRVKHEERSKFERFVVQHSKFHVENQDMVTKLSMGVSNVYNTVTQKVNTAVKDAAPDTHKSTKAIRKGAGGVLKLGGNLLSKGINFAAEQIGGPQPDQKTQPNTPEHMQIIKSLGTLEKAIEAKEVTAVQIQ